MNFRHWSRVVGIIKGHSAFFFLSVLLLLFPILSVCTHLFQDPDDATKNDRSVAQQAAASLPAYVRPVIVDPRKLVAEATNHLLAVVPASFCESSEKHLVLPLRSELGAMDITVALDPGAKTLRAEVMRQGIDLPALLKPELVESLNAICVNPDATDQYAAKGDGIANDLRAILTHVAPDCKTLVSGKDGWVCTLNSISPANAFAKLEEYKRVMLHSWKRQPYVLSRRLSLSQLLAKALEDSASKEQLTAFCHILASSLVEEAPLSLRSPIWNKLVCQGDIPSRAAALVGLSKSVNELAFFMNLIDETTHSGTLTMQLPHPNFGNEDMWIKLEAGNDVTDLVAQTAQKIRSRGKNEGSSTTPGTAQAAGDAASCWHPLFQDGGSQAAIARVMGLIAPMDGMRCDVTGEHTPLPADMAYLLDVVTGETAFTLANGHAKLLILPPGTYIYKVYEMSKSIERWSPEGEVLKLKGEIRWSDKRPYPVISESKSG